MSLNTTFYSGAIDKYWVEEILGLWQILRNWWAHAAFWRISPWSKCHRCSLNSVMPWSYTLSIISAFMELQDIHAINVYNEGWYMHKYVLGMQRGGGDWHWTVCLEVRGSGNQRVRRSEGQGSQIRKDFIQEEGGRQLGYGEINTTAS